MANITRRVTQLDVARAAGVNRATVSLALRKQPCIPETTRLRIEKIAADLGYEPDPMLAALAYYRSEIRKRDFHGTIAWLAQTVPDYKWRDVPHFSTYLAAAEKAAAKHGYRVEVFDINQMGITWSRASAIAKARGIRGVLVCPQPKADTMLDQFNWSDFSAVTFGYSVSKPQLHSVTSAHYRGVLETMRQLAKRGYRRVGFAFRPEHDARANHAFTAGFLTGCQLHPTLEALPVCPDDGHDSDGHVLRAWLKAQKPDVLITPNPRILKLLESWGIKPSPSFGVACVVTPLELARNGTGESTVSTGSRTPKMWGLSGIVEDDERIGEVAVDLLVSMNQLAERGVPEKPQRVLIEGMWNEGTTLRRA